MSYLLRDSTATIVHIDDEVIRASVGVGELFSPPTVTLRACYGVPISIPSAIESAGSTAEEGKQNWLVGNTLENVTSVTGWEEKVELRWPFVSEQGKKDDWEGREVLLLHLYSLLGIKISQNTSPLLLIPPASPPVLPLPVQALYTQLAFERLNVPGFSLLPSPLATLFALGATTGLVLHVGRKSSSAWVVVDSVVRCDACASIPVGQEDCEIAFLRLLMSDEKLEQELRSVIGEERFNTEGKEKYVKEVCQVVWKECLTDDIEIPVAGGGKGFVVGPTEEEEEEQFDVARKLVGDTSGPSHSHKSKKQQAAIAQAAQAAATKAAAEAQLAAEQAAALDFISLTIPSIPDKEISLGSVRHKICEPLLHSVDIGSETIWEGMGRAVNSPGLSMKERVDVWEAVGVVGDMARIKSFPPALVTYLAPFLLSSAELPSDIQPGHVRLLHIPDYFSNYKGSTLDVAPFLGGCMVSRLAFGDVAGKHAITKVDYNARGPSAIYAVGNEGR